MILPLKVILINSVNFCLAPQRVNLTNDDASKIEAGWFAIVKRCPGWIYWI
jgi:hypothetical protein